MALQRGLLYQGPGRGRAGHAVVIFVDRETVCCLLFVIDISDIARKESHIRSRRCVYVFYARLSNPRAWCIVRINFKRGPSSGRASIREELMGVD